MGGGGLGVGIVEDDYGGFARREVRMLCGSCCQYRSLMVVTRCVC